MVCVGFAGAVYIVDILYGIPMSTSSSDATNMFYSLGL